MKRNQSRSVCCGIRVENDNIVETQGRNVMVMMTYLCLFVKNNIVCDKYMLKESFSLHMHRIAVQSRRNNKNNFIFIDCVNV